MLNLDFTILEESNNNAIVITDVTTNWGVANGNIEITAINDIDYTLTLDVTFNSKDQVIVYNQINLYSNPSFGGPWTTQSDLVFRLTPSELTSTQVISNTEDSSLIQDGVYEITYTLTYVNTADSPAIATKKVLINGIVRNKVYTNLKDIPKIYDAYDFRGKEIDDTLLQYALLKSQEASAYVALEQDLLDNLDTLQKLLINGTNYTWK
jgi:hypothetical protein